VEPAFLQPSVIKDEFDIEMIDEGNIVTIQNLNNNNIDAFV